MAPRLRVFTDDDLADDSPTATTVNVRLADILDPLLDAARTRRTFLSDFADDELSIPADLYDVLLAYKELRPSA